MGSCAGRPVEFATLAGPLEIHIPPGSQAGRKLRVKGKGLPSKQPGDLYLVLQIVVPLSSAMHNAKPMKHCHKLLRAATHAQEKLHEHTLLHAT